LGPWKILVADRNRHVRELLRRVLTAEGYRVQVAKDGLEVWTRLTGEEPPDLLILDLEIPYLEELQELALFRESEPRLPLIIYSFTRDYPHDFLTSRAALFLEKMENTDRLKAAVDEVISKHYHLARK